MQETNNTEPRLVLPVSGQPAAPVAPQPSKGGLRNGGKLAAVAVALLLLSAGGLAGYSVASRGASAQSPGSITGTPTATVDVGSMQSLLVSVAQQVGPSVVSIRTDNGEGSGVIYDASGFILTNAHVVDQASGITVALMDGRHFAGKVLGEDQGFDLAVVKIDAQGLPTATLGDSSALQVGDVVVAIGNPYGYDHTVTTGVISAMNRPMSEQGNTYNQPMLQTDAAINPGNSGGALVNLQGEVVGINSLIAAPDGTPAQGLGFAIPINTAKRIAPQLVANGHITNSGQPYLGASLEDASTLYAPQNISPFFFRRHQAPVAPAGVDHGAVVMQLDQNGPAASAGLQTNDVIVQFDGQEIYTTDELLQRLVLLQPGAKVQLSVLRGGQTVDATMTLGEAPVN